MTVNDPFLTEGSLHLVLAALVVARLSNQISVWWWWWPRRSGWVGVDESQHDAPLLASH